MTCLVRLIAKKTINSAFESMIRITVERLEFSPNAKMLKTFIISQINAKMIKDFK